jgi:hypothetical protein
MGTVPSFGVNSDKFETRIFTNGNYSHTYQDT